MNMWDHLDPDDLRREPLFDRYGEWPTEPIAVPDPNAGDNIGGPAPQRGIAPMFGPVVDGDTQDRFGNIVQDGGRRLHPTDPLEQERSSLGI